MADDRKLELESAAERMAEHGDWRGAIGAAEMALSIYRQQAARRPDRYAASVARVEALIAQWTARAQAAGAPTHFPPSAHVQAIAAVVNARIQDRPLTAEEQGVVVRAKAEAAASGNSTIVNEALAGLADRDDPQSAGRSEAETQRARSLSVELQALITRRRARRGRVPHSVYESELVVASIPPTTDRNLARRFARQSVLLVIYGRHREAFEAALESGRRYVDRTDRDETEDGYYAYVLTTLCEQFLAREDFERALAMASDAKQLFVRYHDRALPYILFDEARAGYVLAYANAATGQNGQAILAAEFAGRAAASYEALGAPVGEPGSMPADWGLHIVPSVKQWRYFRRGLHDYLSEILPG